MGQMMFPSFMSICVVHEAMSPILKSIEDYRWTPIAGDKPHHTYLETSGPCTQDEFDYNLETDVLASPCK